MIGEDDPFLGVQGDGAAHVAQCAETLIILRREIVRQLVVVAGVRRDVQKLQRTPDRAGEFLDVRVALRKPDGRGRNEGAVAVQGVRERVSIGFGQDWRVANGRINAAVQQDDIAVGGLPGYADGRHGFAALRPGHADQVKDRLVLEYGAAHPQRAELLETHLIDFDDGAATDIVHDADKGEGAARKTQNRAFDRVMNAVDFQEDDQQKRPWPGEEVLAAHLVRQGDPFAFTDFNRLGQIVGQAVGYKPAVDQAEADDVGVDGVQGRVMEDRAATEREVFGGGHIAVQPNIDACRDFIVVGIHGSYQGRLAARHIGDAGKREPAGISSSRHGHDFLVRRGAAVIDPRNLDLGVGILVGVVEQGENPALSVTGVDAVRPAKTRVRCYETVRHVLRLACEQEFHVGLPDRLGI